MQTFTRHLQDLLARHPAPRRVWVAASGGPDSCALMCVAAAWRHDRGPAVTVIHVNHGLHPDAQQWRETCRRQAETLGLPFESRRVALPARPARGIEAAAREARYAVFEDVLGHGDVLLTAHHRDDQMETFLLQALRGAGPAGLAAMPEVVALGQGWLLRPLLGYDRSALQALVSERGLAVVSDPANTDMRFDRSYLRQQVVPALKERWPAVARTLSRSARQCAEAAAVVDEVAAADLQRLMDSHGRLGLDTLLALGRARQQHVLRAWLGARALPPASSVKIRQMLDEVAVAGVDRHPCVTWPGGEVRRHGGRLYAQRPLPLVPGEVALAWTPGAPLQLPAALGELVAESCSDGTGLRMDVVPGGGLQVRFRQGGEQLVPAGDRHHRPLKDLLREAGVVPWMRGRVPLIYAGDELVAVADLWLSEAHVAASGKPAWAPLWRDHPGLY